MTNKAYQSQKCILKYSKTQIEKAGRSIRHGCEGDERADAILKIQNYRETHLYPLMLIKNHIAQATKKVSKKGIVARRLKMLATIIDKLERPTLDGDEKNAIQLTRMQDIGGCRAIVENISQLRELLSRLKDSSSVHQIIRTNDYLKPKDSGYSGVHLIYSCFAGSDEENEWKKTKIEFQIRTDLQHAWATSLEIIDTLEGIKLKTSMEGHPEWRRFFKIAGQLVAHTERSCMLSDEEFDGFKIELRELEGRLEVRRKLSRYNLAIKVTTDKKHLPRRVLSHQGLFLVRLLRSSEKESSEEKVALKLQLGAFGPNEMETALSDLAKSEADPEVVISVLVSAGDVRNLKKAYPNYFGSTTKFQSFLTKIIDPDKSSNTNKALRRTSA